MSVEQPKVIDFIGVDKASGKVVLTISDHLEWNDGGEHQVVLQDRINAYLAFIESGEIVESYPDSKGRLPIINIVFKHEPDPSGLHFLAKVREVIEDAGFAFIYQVGVD